MSDKAGPSDGSGGGTLGRLENRPPVSFGMEVLRGIAQVDFMPSALCGAVFLAALFVSGWQHGVYGLLGAAVATATAHALGIEHALVGAGLRGFNGCLVGTGFSVFLGPGHWSTFLLAVFASSLVVVVTTALAIMLGTWDVPTFTIPFCLVTTVMTVGAPGFEKAWHQGHSLAALPATASGRTALTWDQTWHAFLSSFGQIFFMSQWYVGLMFLIGIALANRLAAAMACVGSATALAVAVLLGAPAAEVGQGLLGYNAVLVAMALCGVFIAPGPWSLVYAIGGAGVATVVTAALDNIVAPFGGHALTWPFVLTAVVFVAAVPSIPRLRRT
ncbi:MULTISPECIES: urea transporter [unclassified Streptomyces]|uniref:urea transporter n=1 Tax=unclassified Streptomyces TaxID=2593676 RepID=UPI0033A5D17F